MNDYDDAPPESDRYTDGTYSRDVQDWHVGDSAWKAAAIVRLLDRNAVSPESVHDVGCGAGEVLAQLQPHLPAQTNLLGMDISSDAIDLASSRGNERLEFGQGDYLRLDTDPPELLLLLDVFEHVPDYLGFLRALRGRSDAFVFHIPLDLCVWSAALRSRWMLYMRDKFGHLHYFSFETALATLEDCGYSIVDHFVTDDYQISSSMVPGRRELRSRALYEIRRTIFRRDPRRAASLFPHFNLLVLAHG